jgi:hypothetical protein
VKTPTIVVVAALASASASATGAARGPAIWGGLEPGPHAVGFRVDVLPAAGGAPPLELVTWYPARRSRARPMRFADLLRATPDLRPPTAGFPDTPEGLRRGLAAAMTGDAAAVPEATLRKILEAEMAARREAPPAAGRFPVVLWVPRYATTASQPVVSELLASHGHVVACTRRLAAPHPLPFEVEAGPAKEAIVDAQAGDLRRALAALRARAGVDGARVAVLAWSYAGESAVALQRAEPAVKLVISLSSNVLESWVYRPAALATTDPAELDAAYAVLVERVGRTGERTAPPLLARLPGDTYFLRFADQAHGTFNALEGLIPALHGVSRVQPFSRAGPEAVWGHGAIARHVLRLVIHHLSGASGGAFDGRRAEKGVEITTRPRRR